MRSVLGIILIICFTSLSRAEPFTTVVTSDEAIVRSGPGSDYYPVLQLRSGDKVDVYYEQDEWLAIRPPIGSFSWISAKYVDCDFSTIGTVLADGLASRIGSNFSDACETVQVSLKKGELVHVFERRETPENLVSPLWLKIAPPSGEFRWLHKSAVNAPIRQVQHESDAAAIPELPAPAQPGRAIPMPKLASASVHLTSTRTSAVDPFQRAFSELQREAYIVMTRPTDDDVFDMLIKRATELHQIAPTDIDLEKTYHLLESLQRTRAVRRELAVRRPVSYVPNPQPAHTQPPVLPAYTPTSAQQVTTAAPLRAGVNVGGYDIVGRLGEFDPTPKGHPPYAVVNERGQVVCMISPSQGVDLSSYIGRFVGINGVIGEYQVPGKPSARHITAKSVREVR